MNPLISVIVPIYNVEKYLARCIDSIVNQTYKNLEIILVDDGSPDSCPQMCDDYAKKDSRIKVVHKKNGGLSDARNAGMAVATGEYISFIDSDDWIETSMFELLLNNIFQYDCEISCGGIMMVWENGGKKEPLFPIDKTVVIKGTKEAILDLIQKKHIIQPVWNKLYKKSVIKDVPFPVGKINEDEYWSWKAVSRANGVVCSETVVYNYLQRNNSIMHSDKYNPLFVLEAKCEMCDFIDEKYPEIGDICREDFIYTCLFQALRTKNILGKDKIKLYIPQIKSYAKKYKLSKKYFKSLPIKKKFRLISISNCFGLVCNLQNALNIGNKSNIG